MIKMNQSTGN